MGSDYTRAETRFGKDDIQPLDVVLNEQIAAKKTEGGRLDDRE